MSTTFLEYRQLHQNLFQFQNVLQPLIQTRLFLGAGLATKNRILVGGFVLVLIISYQLAFSETFTLKNELSSLKKEQELAENLPQQLARLNQKKKQYNDFL